MRRVVVTGVGLVTPLGLGRPAWAGILAGEHGFVRLDDARFDRLPARIAAVVPEFQDGSSEPRFVRFALRAAALAIEDARLRLDAMDADEIGVSVGSGMSCVDEIWATAKVMETRGPRRVSPYFVPRILGNMAAGHVCIKYALRGPVFSPSTACATGASSVGEAFRAIKHGDAHCMLAGATESCVDPLSMAGFCQARALTTLFNEEPERASRPFDKARSGFVIGEGAAILVLEELESALRRGARIVGEVLGYGTSADAYHITASHPDGLGARLAMSRALKEARIGPADVGYINAHGTSTPVGDRAELAAIQTIFPTNRLAVSSTKGATGHLLSAAGAVEAAFTVLALGQGVVPPNRNFESADIDLRNIWIPTRSTPHAPRYALSNSFGFGGMNVSLCFGSYPSVDAKG